MPDLEFDEKIGFDGNLELFLSKMEEADPEMGKILRNNIDELKGASDERSRNIRRSNFNTNIVAALDKYEEQEKKV